MHRSDDAPGDTPDDPLGQAILELTSFINDPRQDWRMMAEAGLDLDPVFLPVLVRLGQSGPASVVELSGQVGRDHSTISRQLAKLEAAGLVERAPSQADGRVRTARVTPAGEVAVAALSAARKRLLDQVLADWKPGERETFSRLFERFVEGVAASTKAGS
jgi:DNA-binding MarR family transcriptional regulator